MTDLADGPSAVGGRKRPVARLRTALEEFWGGMTDLSALSLAVCLAVFLLMCGVTAWMFSPRTMAGPVGDFIPRSTADADAFALVEALRMAHTPPQAPTVLFLGSSAVAQMVGDGTALQDALAPLPDGARWQVRVLTTPYQSPLDQMRLVETALAGRDADSPPAVVVIGLGLSRLGWTGERLLDTDRASRIPLRSSWAEAELAALGVPPPPRRPLWAIEQRRFVMLNGLESLTRLALQRPAPRVVDIYARGDGMTDEAAALVRARIADGLADTEPFFALQRRLAERIGALANTNVVFMEEPLSPAFVAAAGLSDALPGFRDALAAFARSVDAAYWPVIENAGLDQHHFFDPLHIQRGEAQRLCHHQIAGGLAQLGATRKAGG